MPITAERIAKHASRLLERWRSERKLLLRAAVDALSVAVRATVCLPVTGAKNNTVEAQKGAFDTMERVMERVTKADSQGLVRFHNYWILCSPLNNAEANHMKHYPQNWFLVLGEPKRKRAAG